MKIRIKDDSIRLRLSSTDLKKLSKKGKVVAVLIGAVIAGFQIKKGIVNFYALT